MRRLAFAALVLAGGGCRAPAATSYVYVWAGDSARTANDFLAVIDANPASPRYGAIVASLPTGAAGTTPHHTEAEMPANGHLLANGFGSGQSFLFDLTESGPKVIGSFGDLAGFSHPHTYWRMGGDTLLTTFQYAADSSGSAPMEHQHMGGGTPRTSSARHTTGGLVLMDERGAVIRSASARDTAIADRGLFPYSAMPMPAIDRVLSTTTNMDESDTASTGKWVQVWRLSDLTLLRSIPMPPGPRGDENRWTGEPRLLADGRSALVHTFMCGLYLVRGLDGTQPTATFVHGFDGKFCGVPVLTGRWWIQTVPEAHALVTLDVNEPEHPREVSRVTFGDGEEPHWLSIDASGRRLVMNSGGSKTNRLYIVNLDPATGALTIDDRFRTAGDSAAGVRLTNAAWPHGFAGKAIPHGSVFSR